MHNDCQRCICCVYALSLDIVAEHVSSKSHALHFVPLKSNLKKQRLSTAQGARQPEPLFLNRRLRELAEEAGRAANMTRINVSTQEASKRALVQPQTLTTSRDMTGWEALVMVIKVAGGQQTHTTCRRRRCPGSRLRSWTRAFLPAKSEAQR